MSWPDQALLDERVEVEAGGRDVQIESPGRQVRVERFGRSFEQGRNAVPLLDLSCRFLPLRCALDGPRSRPALSE